MSRDMSYKINVVSVTNGKQKRVRSPKGIPVFALKSFTIPPNRFEVIKCRTEKPKVAVENLTGIVPEFAPFARVFKQILPSHLLFAP